MGKFVKTLIKTDSKSQKKINEANICDELGIELSDIDFSFLENTSDFDWKDTSISEQNKIGIKAYKKFAF